jgi:hypothetical protein
MKINVCSCADLECKSLNSYQSQQCIKHVMYRSMEHIFRASRLENLTFYDIMTQIQRTHQNYGANAHATINESVCKITVSSLS